MFAGFRAGPIVASPRIEAPGAVAHVPRPRLWEYLVVGGVLIATAIAVYLTHNPTWVAVLAEFVFLTLAALLGGGSNPLRLAMGADGRLSTSKFQFLLWTAVVIFAYVWLYATRYEIGVTDGINEVPTNVLLAMGFSTTTLAAAKGITTSYVNSAKLVKSPSTQPGGSLDLGALVSHDGPGGVDLTKVQMLTWTLIAAAIYLVAVRRAHQEYLNLYWLSPNNHDEVARTIKAHFQTRGVPDIDQALMVLMGLGQAAYLGGKIATTTAPRLASVSPTSGPLGTTVRLTGDNLGASGMVTLDGVPRGDLAQLWTPAGVKVTLPRAGLTPPVTVQLGLIVDGAQSVNTIPFSVT